MESVAAPLGPDRAFTAHKVLPGNRNNGRGRPSTAAGVRHFAAWVHDSDEAARVALVSRGYTLDTTTRRWACRCGDLPPDFLRTADHAALGFRDLGSFLEYAPPFR